ncbi:putative carbohydrate binding domain containing protein [uncultured Mediterranean phage uvMED]|nr:putative carbohydrate binding domain containing protein [uncultured Mediterranean phage uvMED]
MATINLGSIKFKWKGIYAGGTAYTIDDVVSYNGSSYICIQASTGNLPTDTAYFEQMSQKGTDGTNGTDVGATLSNNQIAIKDNSGNIAGVSIGSAGEALKVNASANGYEFGSAGKNIVAKTSNTQSAATSSFDIMNVNIVTTKANPTLVIVGAVSINSRDSSNLDAENFRLDIKMSSDGGSSYSTILGDVYQCDVFAPGGIGNAHNNSYDVNTRLANGTYTTSGVSAGTTLNIVLRCDTSSINDGQTCYINRSAAGGGYGASSLIVYEQ